MCSGLLLAPLLFCPSLLLSPAEVFVAFGWALFATISWVVVAFVARVAVDIVAGVAGALVTRVAVVVGAFGAFAHGIGQRVCRIPGDVAALRAITGASLAVAIAFAAAELFLLAIVAGI